MKVAGRGRGGLRHVLPRCFSIVVHMMYMRVTLVDYFMHDGV